MSREILVVTPENIEIEYELAGIGSRFLANLLDTFIQMAIYLGVWLVAAILSVVVGLGTSVLSHTVGAIFAEIQVAFGMVAAFLVLWGYFIWFEARWNGQTPGKRQMGLRVIRDGGYPINAYAAVVRNLIRVMDGMPVIAIALMSIGYFGKQPMLAAMGGLCILIPVLCMLLSSRYQRLGDFIAGTMVVKQRAPRIPTLEALAPPPRVLPEHLAPYALADIGRQVYEMTVPEYRAVRHYIDRRWQLPPQMQQTAAMRLAVPLMQRLGIIPPAGVISVNYADLLEYLAVAFEQYRGVK
jgi:uncharacterized RDD family membrane protein YckC